jgi:general secretion pathway protein E
VVEINASLQDMIHNGAPEADLVHEARKSSPSLLFDGAAKIRAGRTTAEEVARVARAET